MLIGSVWESVTWLSMGYPVGIYLLKFNNRNTGTKCEICSKLRIKTHDTNGIVLVSLLLTLNIFHTLF